MSTASRHGQTDNKCLRIVVFLHSNVHPAPALTVRPDRSSIARNQRWLWRPAQCSDAQWIRSWDGYGLYLCPPSPSTQALGASTQLLHYAFTAWCDRSPTVWRCRAEAGAATAQPARGECPEPGACSPRGGRPSVQHQRGKPHHPLRAVGSGLHSAAGAHLRACQRAGMFL